MKFAVEMSLVLLGLIQHISGKYIKNEQENQNEVLNEKEMKII